MISFSKSKLFDLLFTGFLFTFIINSSLIFEFSLYRLIGSICATIYFVLFFLCRPMQKLALFLLIVFCILCSWF